MNPEITIKIAMATEGATISQGQVSTPMVMGEVPDPPSLEESGTLAGMEDVVEAPGPPSQEEMEALAGTDMGEVPGPTTLEETEAITGVDVGEAPRPPSPEETETIAGMEDEAFGPESLE